MNAPANELAGKVALITGASRGIGKGIALALAHAGADVVVNFRHRELEANALVATLGELGRRAISLRADVSNEDEVRRLVAESEDALGPIAILVNNAGIAKPTTLHDVTIADWDHTHTQNLRSAFLVTQAVVPGMRQRRWGRILFLGSIAAQVGGVVGPDYAASKAGLTGLMHYYAHHLVSEGITANLLAPARIDTDMIAGISKARPEDTPIGRFGTVDEAGTLAAAILANGYVTGQTINLNGGWYPSS